MVKFILGPRLLVPYTKASQKNHGKFIVFPEPFELLEKWFHISINVNFTSNYNNGNTSSVVGHFTNSLLGASHPLGPFLYS